MAYAPLLQERWRTFITKYRQQFQLGLELDPVPALSFGGGNQTNIT